MRLLILGRGKTGTLVAEVARERGHQISVIGAQENPGAAALTKERLANVDAVIEFTTPHAVIKNIEACAAAGCDVVVGTTGWLAELEQVREKVDAAGIGFLYAANFSVGMNLFFEVARTAAAALDHRYFGQIFERHHAQKQDAPSGTAIMLREIVKVAAGQDLEITSFREGQVVGMHELTLDSPHDTIYVCHDAKSRRGFAEGAIRGAEWLAGKKGMFNFANV
ncbi:MAG: 4-hydroxy-tetrahydrodipicolinate reductase, partial [Acidobacteriales bacterium]|nr:4-hydroxy-tetrahydrodipicolinate reductase [Terriglobales bacterium]